MLVAARRSYVRASLHCGELATAEGACIGVVTGTGRRAAISWRESRGGVLVTGQDAAAVTRTALDLAIAAILHRKAVLIVDLTGGLIGDGRDGCGIAAATKQAVLRRVTAASADVAAPLAVFGSGGDCYEPFSGAGPAMATSLLLSMIDWGEGGQSRRTFCADYVWAALEVIASRAAGARATAAASAAAASGAAGTAAAASVAAGTAHNILDELAALLRPGAIQARVGRPDGHPAIRRYAGSWPRRTASCPPTHRRQPPSPSNWLGSAAPPPELPSAARRAAPVHRHRPGSRPAAGGPVPARPACARPARPDDCATRPRRSIRTLSERAGAPADYLVWINGCDALDEHFRRCDRPRLGSRGNDDRQHRVRDDRWRDRWSGQCRRGAWQRAGTAG